VKACDKFSNKTTFQYGWFLFIVSNTKYCIDIFATGHCECRQ